MSDSPEKPFILVLAQFFPETDPFKSAPQEILAPFAHLGMELTSRDESTRWPRRAPRPAASACRPPTCRRRSATSACSRDPDGNTVEYSFDQGVYAKAKEVWGS